MQYDATISRPNKERCRDYLIEKHFSGRIAKVALFFPSDLLLCIKQALKERRINRQTKIIAIESDCNKIGSIYTYLSSNFNEFYIQPHKAEFCDLHEVTKEFGKIDLAYFDFCGPLSNSIFHWLFQQVAMSNACSFHAHIGFTFSLSQGQGTLEESALLKTRNQPMTKRWLDRITGFQDHGKKLHWENSASATLSLLSYAMTPAFKINYREEYQDQRAPMLFITMTKIKQTWEYKENQDIGHFISKWNIGVPDSAGEPKKGIWSSDSLDKQSKKRYNIKTLTGESMSTTITSSQVTTAIVSAHQAGSAGLKAAATRKQNAYLLQQKKLGHKPEATLAGIRAAVNRKLNALAV